MKHLTLIAFFLSALPASAGELIFGLGGVDYGSSQASSDEQLTLEYHFDPLWTWQGGQAGPGVAFSTTGDGDIWVGAGLAARFDLGERWFAEGSFMPGYYDEDSPRTSLGGDIIFRTQIGLGYELNDRQAISLALEHKSNAGLESRNPGLNAVSLRFHQRF